MQVPYAAVVAAVRACLPAGITLTDFSEAPAGVEPVYDLLNLRRGLGGRRARPCWPW